MKAKRKRTRVTKTTTEIVSSTAFALSKNPDLYKNVKEYTPDHKERKAKKAQQRKDELNAKFEAMCKRELNKSNTMKNSKKNSAKKVGRAMQAKAVSYNPKVRKLVMAPGGSLCPIEDMRNPNA